MKKSNIIYLFIVVVISLGGCAKDGETGTQGPAGTNGTNGTNGNANVYSFNYEITQWGFDTTYCYSEIFASDGLSISSADIDNGALLAYIKTPIGWSALTYTCPLGGDKTQFYRGFFSTNHFLLKVNNSDGSSPNPPQLAASDTVPRKIKIVVIPQLRLANPNVNLNNYEAVKAEYNLID